MIALCSISCILAAYTMVMEVVLCIAYHSTANTYAGTGIAYNYNVIACFETP